jgi:hypothetical protein
MAECKEEQQDVTPRSSSAPRRGDPAPRPKRGGDSRQHTTLACNTLLMYGSKDTQSLFPLTDHLDGSPSHDRRRPRRHDALNELITFPPPPPPL